MRDKAELLDAVAEAKALETETVLQHEAALTNLTTVCREANREGLSWADIGAALGVTRQAAWERFAERSDQ